ncbi:MAG: sigma-70 family RNA polymerase sigma factor [Nitrospinota bacterium]|nr:MAG: sigma-70 family RNA polymerase sigma factor [Nitrospinota bacterium]
MNQKPVLDPEIWVEQYGDYLFRYAMLRIRDPALAENLVQETFLAALHNRDTFAGHSSERTWLTGILKRKVIDHLRRRSRERPVSEITPEDSSIEDLFDERGAWKVRPNAWGIDPSEVLEKREFWASLTRCTAELPPRLAQAFLLREVDGLSSEEICKVLQVSTTNLWVMLHRARLRLRQCLENHWFAP